MAAVGIESDVFARADMSWSDQSGWPIGTAIRTGQPVPVQHILQDARFAKWHDHARALGYTSAVALPIVAAGAALGVFRPAQTPI